MSENGTRHPLPSLARPFLCRRTLPMSAPSLAGPCLHLSLVLMLELIFFQSSAVASNLPAMPKKHAPEADPLSDRPKKKRRRSQKQPLKTKRQKRKTEPLEKEIGESPAEGPGDGHWTAAEPEFVCFVSVCLLFYRIWVLGPEACPLRFLEGGR